MWDGKKGKDPPVATRLHGLKRATSVSVGETHLLVIGSLYHPKYFSNEFKNLQKQKSDVRDELDELNEDLMFDDTESHNFLPLQNDDSEQRLVPSLKSICEKVAADNLVEPRNAIQLLEIADTLGADELKKYCEVLSWMTRIVAEHLLLTSVIVRIRPTNCLFVALICIFQ